MTDDSWTRISAPTLADQVYSAVRGRIMKGDMEAGDFIREQEISDALGVSRTPVREALGRLASEGFLERIPHRGFRVPEESVTRLLELYPIVSALELLAGRLAFPRVGKQDIDELRDINEDLRDAAERNEVQAAIELNNRFHSQISEKSGNRRLADLLDDLRSQLRALETWYYSNPEHAKQSVREHDALVDALETEDMEKALAIFERNMMLTMTTLLEETEQDLEVRFGTLTDGGYMTGEGGPAENKGA